MKVYYWLITFLGFGDGTSITAQTVPPLPVSDFISLYGASDNITWLINNKKPVTVAFLGGSITNMNGWRDMVCNYLRDKYTGTTFNFINAGIPSLGSLPHAFRLQTDVLDKGKIDWLFVESAVNDLANGTPELQQRRALEGIIRHAIMTNPKINIVLMAFADEFKIAGYKAGKIPAEVAVHDQLAGYYQLPFIDLAREVYQRIDAKEFSWEKDFKNLHPSPFGQQLYFNSIRHFIDTAITIRSTTPVAKKFPAPLQPFSYTRGSYMSVSMASGLKGFSVVPSWKPADSVNTRAGFVDVPVLEGNMPGAYADLSFTGTAIGIAVVAGPDAGSIRYTVDHGKEQSIDLYDRNSAHLHLPRYLLLADELATGKHLIHIIISEEKNQQSKGRAVRIVHFLVNQ